MVAAPAPCSGLGLRALLCCIFEKDIGPRVVCSDPPDAVGKQFKPLGRYLLPEDIARGRVISVVLDDDVVLGAPVYIDDTRYDRNCFQFVICLVIGSREDTEPHRDLAQHLAMSFHALEVEIKLLSRGEKVPHVQSILASLRAQLNACEEVYVHVTDSHCIAFQVRHRCPALAARPSLSQVPVPLVDLASLLDLPCWPAGGSRDDAPEELRLPGCSQPPPLPFEPDVTLLQMAPLVDGVRSVQDIVQESNMDFNVVLICLQHLLHFELVAVIDAIELESRYSLTPDFHVAFEREEVSAEVVPYVTGGRRETSVELLNEVQVLYAGMNGWDQTLGEFQKERERELSALDISLRHFITFGLLKGFLEPLHQALSSEQLRERELLQGIVRETKNRLLDQGLPRVEVNRVPEVKTLVTRMNALKVQNDVPQR